MSPTTAALAAPSAPVRSARPWYDTPNVRKVLVLAAILGLALGVETVILHATTDPLADIHAYQDAAMRLNAGMPLYDQPATVDEAAFYRYPPLLAVLFRPFASLPFDALALAWEAILMGAVALTIVRLGSRRKETWVVLGMLALPLGWALTVGQAQVVVTLLLALGAPWSLALATHLKLFPALAALWWIGRREWWSLLRFAVWLAVLGLVQLVLEPAGTLAYPGFLLSDQVGNVANISPFAVSPVLWGVLVVIGIAAAVRLAPTRLGWAAAVAVAVLASPRLLVYQLSSLAAATRSPDTESRP